MIKFEKKNGLFWKVEYLENIREYVFVISDGGYSEKYMIHDWALGQAIDNFKLKLKTKYDIKLK
jgi:hypothetical protein